MKAEWVEQLKEQCQNGNVYYERRWVKMHQLFGKEMEDIIEELNKELVA